MLRNRLPSGPDVPRETTGGNLPAPDVLKYGNLRDLRLRVEKAMTWQDIEEEEDAELEDRGAGDIEISGSGHDLDDK